MPDAIFADPRLAALYDRFDGPRDDLAAYVDLVAARPVRTIVDIGCGTGSLALLLAGLGYAVTGIDPAAASLAVARGKPGADRVTWVLGEARELPPAAYDVALMTGNVAQVFIGEEWPAVMTDLARVVRRDGWLVLETRRPEARAWEGWAATPPVTVEGVTATLEVTHVDLPLVTFRWTFRFPGGEVLASDSTLAFRDRDEVERDLTAAGFAVHEIRDAPDRPGLEWVFLARRSG